MPCPSKEPPMSTTPRPPKSWIAVASAGHVAIGRAQGFAQVNHGKSAPLKRILPGDALIYYAPTQTFGGKGRLQAFVAYGRVAEGEIYQGIMAEGFQPFRRNVLWADAADAPIAPLLSHLSFTAGKTNWGAPFRYGLFEIPQADRTVIARAMGLPPQA